MSHKTTTFSSSLRNQPQTYKFVPGSVFTDNGQDFINVTSSFESADNKTLMSSYYVRKDGVKNFMDELVPIIMNESRLSNPTLIGPTYFDKDGKISDYQCSVTGTAKSGETEIMALQRELAEEIGFIVKSSAIGSLTPIMHTNTKKNGMVQECATFMINVADIEPATCMNVRECNSFFNLKDLDATTADGKPLEKKIQAFLFGDYSSCIRTISMHTIKPVMYAESDVEHKTPLYYDDDIKGITVFNLNKISRRFGVSSKCTWL